jgi:hypothetical protein
MKVRIHICAGINEERATKVLFQKHFGVVEDEAISLTPSLFLLPYYR